MNKKLNKSRQQFSNFLRNIFNLEQFELLPNAAVTMIDQKSRSFLVLNPQLLVKLLQFFKIDPHSPNFQINLAHINIIQQE